jgi:hypothetical protein
MMVNIQRPTTLDGLLAVAIDYESRILTRARERRTAEYKPRFGRERGTALKAARLAEEERNKQMKEGRCFICNQTGHMARTCPKW